MCVAVNFVMPCYELIGGIGDATIGGLCRYIGVGDDGSCVIYVVDLKVRYLDRYSCLCSWR